MQKKFLIIPGLLIILVLIFIYVSLFNTTLQFSLINATAGYTTRQGYSLAVFNNKMWMIGGEDTNTTLDPLNDVWYSTDGNIWTLVNGTAAFPPRQFSQSPVYNGKLWEIGGKIGFPANSNYTNINDTWSSADGNIWKLVNSSAGWTARRGASVVVFDNQMYLIAGYDNSKFNNDIWTSTDGNIWTRIQPNAAFPGRYLQQVLVYNGKMWLIGGYNGTYFNDTWYSTNGITWKQGAVNASFPARVEFGAAVYDNKMWIVGGWDRRHIIGFNDTWYSTDGINWYQFMESAEFQGRDANQIIPFGNSLYILGGTNDSTDHFGYNDSWCIRAS